MASLNAVTHMLDRGKVYVTICSMFILITVLYVLDMEISPSIHEYVKCGVGMGYNYTANVTTQS